MDWNIQNEGRAWTGDEARQRYEMTPEKIELIKGKLFWSDEDRITMLALLLENIGADQAVQLGNPQVWQAAVAKLPATATKTPEELGWPPGFFERTAGALADDPMVRGDQGEYEQRDELL